MVWSHITLCSDGPAPPRERRVVDSLLPWAAMEACTSRVTMDDMVDEWVGGLGIGVTRSVSTWRRGPDKAWRMPKHLHCWLLALYARVPTQRQRSMLCSSQSSRLSRSTKVSAAELQKAPFRDAGAVLVPRLRWSALRRCGSSYRSASAAVTPDGSTIGLLQTVTNPTVPEIEQGDSASQDDSDDFEPTFAPLPKKGRLSAPQLQAQLSLLSDGTRLRRLKHLLHTEGAVAARDTD